MVVLLSRLAPNTDHRASYEAADKVCDTESRKAPASTWLRRKDRDKQWPSRWRFARRCRTCPLIHAVLVAAPAAPNAMQAFKLEDLLETVGRSTAKATGNCAEQINIYRTLCPFEGIFGIG